MMNEAESNFIAFRKDSTRRNTLYLLSGLLLVGSLGGLRAAPAFGTLALTVHEALTTLR